MSLKKYLKNAIKYIFYDHKPQQVHVKTYNIPSSDILRNKIVFITGGTSGIGYSIASKFSKNGAKVIITGRNKEKLEKVKDELNLLEALVVDSKEISSFDETINYIYDKYGKIDILINNAGISLHENSIANVSEENYDLQFDTNLKGPYFLTQKVINKYLEKKHSSLSIIFISSERGSFVDDVPYGLTKNAINCLTKGLSRRYYKNGIRVNAIAPGVTATNLTGFREEDDLYRESLSSGRLFLPDEISEIVLFICSDYAKCISGEVINCDAGNHISSYF